MSQALITPQVLRWARERARTPAPIVASKAHVKLQQLESWELGEDRPTLRQAKNLARVLHVPFGYLFLSSPPKDSPAIPDLRTVRDAALRPLSADFCDLESDVLRKRDWYREHLRQYGSKPLEFVGKFHLTDSSQDVAADIAAALNLTARLRREAGSWDGFLRSLIRRTEKLRILVLRSGIVGNNTRRKLEIEEFRGFAVCDEIAPLIFINSADAKAAQIFTLAHELAHVWLGESGISNPDLSDLNSKRIRRIEAYCNQVAADVLTPRTAFLHDWRADRTKEENVRRLGRIYRVSQLVIIRRAYDLDKINKESYSNLCRRHIESRFEEEARQETKDGGDFYATLFARNSSNFASAVVTATLEGRELRRDAAALLGVKVKTLDGVAQRLGIR